MDWEALYEDYYFDDEPVDNTTLLFSSGSLEDFIVTSGKINEKSPEQAQAEAEQEEAEQAQADDGFEFEP